MTDGQISYEAQAYTMLYEITLGPVTVLQLSKRTGMSRNDVSALCEIMRSNGTISYSRLTRRYSA